VESYLHTVTLFIFVNATGIQPDVNTSNPSTTLRFKFQLLSKKEVFFLNLYTFNAFMNVRCTEASSAWGIKSQYGAPRPAACEKLKVSTVHQDQ